MIKNKIALTIIAAVSIAAVGHFGNVNHVSKEKNVVLQESRVVNTKLVNGITANNYNKSNNTIKGTITLSKSVDLGNNINSISITTNTTNPTIGAKEFNGVIVSKETGKVYNTATYKGIVPVGSYTYVLNNISSAPEQVYLQLSNGIENFNIYSSKVVQANLVNGIIATTYDRTNNTLTGTITLSKSVNLSNYINSISITTNTTNPAIGAEEFNGDLVSMETGKVYATGNCQGIVPAGVYKYELKNLPSGSTNVYLQLSNLGNFNIYNATMPKAESTLKNGITATSYDLANETLKGSITLSKSVNLGNDINSIGISTNTTNPVVGANEFNGVIVSKETGKVYNTATYKGIVPAGTYSYELKNVSYTSKNVYLSLSNGLGNFNIYDCVMPKVVLVNGITTTTYKAENKTLTGTITLSNPVSLGNYINSISITTDTTNPAIGGEEFNGDLVSMETGKVYATGNCQGIVPAGVYKYELKNVPSGSSNVYLQLSNLGNFNIYNAIM